MNFHPTQGNQRALPSKLPNLTTSAGDCIEVVGPCGGGYGDPYMRDPDSVLEDVLDGYVSRERARTDYGVIIGEDFELNTAATEEARGK